MTSNNATTQRNWKAPRLSVLLVNTGALVATGSAYLAIVGFAQVVLGMSVAMAYTLAGVFEIAMIAVALMARDAVRDGRPHLHLSLITVAMAATSGTFAGWEELHLGHPAIAAAFRFLVAITAAMLWELALVGDKHLASGISWRTSRINRRMQAVQEATEALFRARDIGRRRDILRHEKAYIRAISRARRLVTPDEMRTLTEAQQDSADALVSHLAFTRSGHERINAAFEGRGVQVPRVERRATVRTVTPNAPTLPTVAPVASVASPANETETQDVPAPAVAAASVETPRTSVAATVTRETGESRLCYGCGKPLPASATARAQYCIKYDENGRRSQRCKNLFNSGRGYRAKETVGSVPAFA